MANSGSNQLKETHSFRPHNKSTSRQSSRWHAVGGPGMPSSLMVRSGPGATIIGGNSAEALLVVIMRSIRSDRWLQRKTSGKLRPAPILPMLCEPTTWSCHGVTAPGGNWGMALKSEFLFQHPLRIYPIFALSPPAMEAKANIG